MKLCNHLVLTSNNNQRHYSLISNDMANYDLSFLDVILIWVRKKVTRFFEQSRQRHGFVYICTWGNHVKILVLLTFVHASSRSKIFLLAFGLGAIRRIFFYLHLAQSREKSWFVYICTWSNSEKKMVLLIFAHEAITRKCLVLLTFAIGAITRKRCISYLLYFEQSRERLGFCLHLHVY